jgi:hypothetical protein
MSLVEKLEKIEALIERTSSEGERQAALLAKERILQKQDQLPLEYVITHHNLWKKKLFIALCHKYGLSPYRYKHQKHTTTRVLASPDLMNECLWPEYKKYAVMLEDLVEEILDNLMSKIQGNTVEEELLSLANTNLI